MKRSVVASVGLLASGVALADHLEGADRLLCAPQQIMICVEDADCYPAHGAELGVPDFVIIDLKNKKMLTTKASEQTRTTAFSSMSRSGGKIFLQGVENGRAFSFLIDEATGSLTVAVSRDGVAVAAFGSCTNAKVE
ncbi:MAG TPA: hypothetical protein VMV37_08940 [Gammaproteobacteria bacterium]|nr:hypothetical protein [Gammaproteobacteria bacterium]